MVFTNTKNCAKCSVGVWRQVSKTKSTRIMVWSQFQVAELKSTSPSVDVWKSWNSPGILGKTTVHAVDAWDSTINTRNFIGFHDIYTSGNQTCWKILEIHRQFFQCQKDRSHIPVQCWLNPQMRSPLIPLVFSGWNSPSRWLKPHQWCRLNILNPPIWDQTSSRLFTFIELVDVTNFLDAKLYQAMPCVRYVTRRCGWMLSYHVKTDLWKPHCLFGYMGVSISGVPVLIHFRLGCSLTTIQCY